MKLTKKRSAVLVAAVVAAGITAAGTSVAFADSSSSGKTPSGPTGPTGPHFRGGFGPGVGPGLAGGFGGPGGFGPGGQLSLFLNGGHGSSTTKDSKGAWTTHEWQVGKVSAVAGSTVTVAGVDGTTWSWTTASTTTVQTAGKKGALPDVKVGDEVLVQGTQSGTANDAASISDPGSALIAQWQKDAATRPSRPAGPGWGGHGPGKPGAGAPTTASSGT